MKQNFYSSLEVLKMPVSAVFKEEYFSEVPDSWYIIIADIKNSTAAVAAGKSNDVNLVAAGCLVIALNIARQKNIEIPFFFGGDGGTMIVPEVMLQPLLSGLELHNNVSKNNFGLDMHIGFLSVKKLNATGHFIKIARLQVGMGFTKAIVVGDGLRYAEQLIKQVTRPLEKEMENEGTPDLTGLECRWDKVKSPSEEKEVICYLIEAVDAHNQVHIYHDVMQTMDEVFGEYEKRNPITPGRLKLSLHYDKVKREMLVKYGGWKPGYFLVNMFKNFLGHLSIKYNLTIKNFNGGKYLAQLIANADTITIDGRINTVVTGTMDKRLQFNDYLKRQEAGGHLIFGHYISRESIMTCYIENRSAKHIHFVDGSDGGYTEASKEFKKKFNLLKHFE